MLHRIGYLILIISLANLMCACEPSEVELEMTATHTTQAPPFTPKEPPNPTATFTPTATVSPPATSETPTGMELIPAGKFWMGRENGSSFEKPVHEVELSAYYIDVYEITNANFTEFVIQTGYLTDAENEGQSFTYAGNGWWLMKEVSWQYPRGVGSNLSGLDDYPVVHISWNDAVAYCAWRGARLPTEAEWEYAARGGLEGNLYPWGNDNPVCQAGVNNGAKFDDNANCNDTGSEPVGSYAANGYGLYDMAGNVSEWVNDWYSSSYYEQSPSYNPTGPGSGDYRVVRGGSWGSDPKALHVAFRYISYPADGIDVGGFRCARTP